LKVKAIKCHNCEDVIFSRTRDDFRECSCRLIHVDGGFEYFKVGHVSGSKYEIIELNLPVSMDDLYEDWNEMTDQYGVVHI
jgi:hypothetical protein